MTKYLAFSRLAVTAFTVTSAVAAGGLLAASPAAAGGIGDFLSPAFGTSCTNHHGTLAGGVTTSGTGAGDGNLLGLPLGSPLNQCGGADLSVQNAGSTEASGEGAIAAESESLNVVQS
ncbi:hypothetical protein [Streptomyces sp. NPDC057939]|uniref:hypothetical protein n=1 Tax=Streptomyces sp. NPDC057939 TaxID=3346284 RepID=UPI0036DFAC67